MPAVLNPPCVQWVSGGAKFFFFPGICTRCPALPLPARTTRDTGSYCRNSFNAPWESEHQPTWQRPRYDGTHPLYRKQTLLWTCHSWIGLLLPVPGDASGVGGDASGKLPTRVRSPGGEAGCQRHLDDGECGCGPPQLYASPIL